MVFRRNFLVFVAAGLLLLALAPRSVSADITGNVYNFGATWYDQTYQVDNAIIQQETHQGSLQITVNNITPSDAYEYTYTGFNHHDYGSAPYYDEQNDSIDFQENKVYFSFESEDTDGNDLAESIELHIHPDFNNHHPGHFFFVNPVWSTQTTDWNSGVTEVENADAIQQFTESAGEGSFSFLIVVGIEYEHLEYGNLTGTVTITFNAAYDADGVLSSWSLQNVNSAQNENHTVILTVSETYARGSTVGAVIPSDMSVVLGVAGVTTVAGIIVGALIGKRYLA
jgi:hypothetical protein